MTLKNIAALLELWEELNMKSKKFTNNDCKNRWFKFQVNKYMVGALRYLAKEGNLEMCNKTKHEQHSLDDVFDNGYEYDVSDMDTPFLKPKNKEDSMNEGHKVFKETVRKFMSGDTKTFV